MTRIPFLRKLPVVTPIFLISHVLAAAAVAAEAPRAASLEVDARDAPRRLFHARLTLPAMPGPITLAYPKWIPGEHGPTGPIADLTGLTFSAAGKTLAWKRDGVDMYAFHLDVPAGSTSVDVTLDLLSPPDAAGFSSGSSATANLVLLSWNQLLLYPKGAKADDLVYAASLRLPASWKYGTALSVAAETPEKVTFSPVSLTTLVDSPVLAGAHLRVFSLSDGPVLHRLFAAADGEAALAAPASLEAAWKSLVQETGALYGARHYRSYSFLLTLSDYTAHFGLEHHESSDDRVAERSLVDEDRRRMFAGLLPHEMTHSWNGKYRRPEGLAIGRFDEPMKGELLWVYEGLTEYLGWILTARSGLLTPEEYREALALTAAEMDHQAGRSWRPLIDTAVAAQILYEARPDGYSWRRGVDYYPEGELLWLEADAIIRRETKGAKSLDDFCRFFFGGESGPPKVVPYSFDDVLAALNQVAPYGWKGFWTSRLNTREPRAPFGGVLGSGWTLTYTDKVPQMQKSEEEARKVVDVRFSIGFRVKEDGEIPDVLPLSPAEKAGVGPGMNLVAVNGRRWNKDVLRDAIRETKDGRPLELIVENGEFFRTCLLDYAGGERYPHLVRDTTKDDILSEIIRSHAKR
jgi:predicted metalloprotease with PDZ domain